MPPPPRSLSIFIAHPSALLTDYEPYGDGLLAYRYLAGLAARGHEIDVAAQEVRVRAPLPPNLRIHEIARGGHMGLLRRIAYARRVRRLYERLAPKRRFDLIQQLNPVVAGLTILLPHDVPVLLGPYPRRWPRSLAALRDLLRGGIQRIEQRRASMVLLFVSSATTGVRTRQGRPTPQIAVVPPGVDLDRFHPGVAPAAVEEARTVLFLANLSRRKGVFVLLAAFERVAVACPEARLVIAGTGPASRQVRSRAKRSSAADRIELLGRIEPAQVPETMRRATIYCLPSLGEPFGMSALEAMACARPVVVTAAGGLDDLVPQDCGAKVPPGDVDALAAALERLLALPSDALAEMGARGRNLAERYSWNAAIDALERAYAVSMASTTGSAPISPDHLRASPGDARP